MKGRVVSRGETPASAGNAANIITVVRILFAPVFIYLLLADAHEDTYLRYIAAGLFILAILTDFVDGLLARRRNLVTDTGKLLDPIADKILIGGALVSLSILGELPWWITIVILVRELGITAHRLSIARHHVIPASWFGKIKTVVQAVAISLALVPFPALLGPWVNGVNTVFMSVALVLTLISGIEYIWQVIRAGRVSRTGAAAA
ncbi:MAG TPA: CDP-diacylglycerol--glycerol-3-phosphate 3-phosphatidyltransferase [Pseudolysinimonas sp.]|nr:CDP-diacylglycerol--glycerol-3-phosphate 3-phosphatidyltransferase [Pseudolysinimonas sp.]